ncbi:lactate dehydrogenase [Rhodopila globiformis]|uniref:Lactate dehydrogenase n=2 Tax=Rhodopila globiformis TaxID=1071 RepID=A0A2S6NM63_RHOGL|nr:lactate dehydrogenase [Rhodopila globiformis]
MPPTRKLRPQRPMRQEETAMPASYASHRAQLKSILLAWGMPEENAETTSAILSWADLHGVDSHGISMIPGYDGLRRAGRARMDAQPIIVRETPVSAVVDGGGGLGHVPAHFAMATAIGKAKAAGMAAVVVHHSAHFGAAGYYTLMAAEQGLIGIACTSASGIQVAPTFGKQARLGTDPWSFAAPSADGVPFLLDMATTTVAAGRIRNKANEGLPAPDGWLLDSEGRPSNDPLVAKQKGGFLTSLGGSPENSSYKGYGLAVMVNILASCLSGATLVTDPMHTKKPIGMDIGHFFMAIDPSIFRESGDFQADVAAFLGALRATTPMDPARPVMVAGDPQRQYAEARRRDGIPVGPGLLNQVRQIAQAAAAPWLLD